MGEVPMDDSQGRRGPLRTWSGCPSPPFVAPARLGAQRGQRGSCIRQEDRAVSNSGIVCSHGKPDDAMTPTRLANLSTPGANEVGTAFTWSTRLRDRLGRNRAIHARRLTRPATCRESVADRLRRSTPVGAGQVLHRYRQVSGV